MMEQHRHDVLWNGDKGAGGISWADRSRMGPLRGVIDAADISGRRNAYMHTLHLGVLLRELKYVAERTSFLDFGCGTGRFITRLATYCDHLVAVDKEPTMLDAARAYSEPYNNVSFECCEPARLELPSGGFDFVLCSSVLCVTIQELLEGIIRELGRVTKSGGTILLMEQASEARGLPLRRYHDALAEAGCSIERAYPIRSARSRMTSVVGRSAWIPPSFYRSLASLELFVTGIEPWRRPASYVEYAIVARRR